jgi:hypothetical protein
MKEFIKTFFEDFLPALWLAISRKGPQKTEELVDWIKPRAKKIWGCFLVLALILINVMIVSLDLSLLFEAGWIAALAGVILALTLMIVMFKPVYLGLAILLGITWEILHLEIEKAFKTGLRYGKLYLDIGLGILLWELIVLAYISIFPVWNNPQALPVLALFSLLAGLMIYVWKFERTFFRKFAYRFVVVILILETLSFFFPLTSQAINKKMPAVDRKISDSIRAFDIHREPSEKKDSSKKPVRRLSGIFKLPKDGTKVTKDINGHEYSYLKGEKGYFWQLGPTGQFTVLNKKISSLVIDQPTYTTGPAISDGKVELMATGGKDVIVELKILPPCS